MGFYGNITNTSNTTFSFDKIYSNRREMDSNANNDGIFIGRYVLVEYDQDAAYPVVFMNKQTNKFYSSKNFDQATEIRYISGDKSDEYILTTDTSVVSGKQYYKLENDKYIDVSLNSNDNPRALGLYEYVSTSDGVYKDEIVQVQEVTSDEKTGNLITIFIGFYQCEGTYDGEHAQFKQLDKDPNAAKSNYIKNFAIDEKHLNGEQQKSFKGYDSTVWMKSSVTASDGKLITKYVNIADLNSVVPTFDIAADAPTMTPITPHFDADSTNVYYKLHVQPQWGMRVAAANGSNSDVETYWTRENYNPSTGLSTKQYWNKNSSNWVDYTNEEEIQTFDAAIYYNRAGFEEYERNYVNGIKLEDNIINIEPTGESGNLYNNHNQSNSKSTAKDIQEIRINLPAIGNMMSDAWDIIHGLNRDDARTDVNGSLQGRLDSFRFMAGNQIPVKRANDGTLIGTNINGNNQCEVPEQGILGQSLTTSFDTDDAWIRTEINTNGLLDELGNEIGNNGISIHHTFHSKKDTETSANKNNSDGDGINKGIGNDLKLYTPIVDAAGHVVGKNTETVTLPYGYKTVKAKEQSVAVTNPNTNTNEVIADSTQDTLQFASSNKWIRMSGSNSGTGVNYDTFNIGHEVHSIDETVSDQGDNETSHTNANKENGAENEINLTMYDWTYDEAGHITSKRQHTYTLPYGFKTINVGNDTTESAAPAQTGVKGETADNTQDSLTFEATNKWIKMAAVGEDKENKITFGHELSDVITTDKELTNLNAEITKSDSIVIPDWSYDAAGHITSKQKHEYILPYGYKSFTDGTNVSIANSTQDRFNLVGDDWLQSIVANDTITYKHIGPVKPEIVNDKNNIENPQFGSIFIIEDWHFDNKGHMHTSGKTHTVQFPKGSIEHPIATSNNSEIITSLSFVPESGKISYQKDNSSTLKLTTDYTNNGIGAGNIAGGDSLNTAFAKLEKQIMQEANTRATDILKEASDRDTAIKTAIANLVDSAPDNINTLGEIVAWLDNDGDEKIDIIKDIAKNASDISNEVSRATDAEGTLQEKIDILQSWKDTATQDIADLNNIISQMQITIQDLQKQIGDLKNPPQEPDNGGETV